MKAMPSKQTSDVRGFTLLELLMVIAIISILMSMSVVVMLGFKDSAEEEATSATVQKLARLVEQRVEAFDRAFRGVREQQAVTAMRGVLLDPNGNGNRADAVYGVYESAIKILAKKSLFRFEFPQSFSDRLDLGDSSTWVTGLPDSMYIAIVAPTVRTDLGLPATTSLTAPAIVSEATTRFAKHQKDTESAECLYFQLFASGNYGATAVDGDRFTEREIQDTDGDGLPEFIDAWGNPIRFYRWPTRMIDVDAPFPFQPVLSDPSDNTDVIVTVDTNGDGTPDTTIGQRRITADERMVANIMMRGLPPAPSLLPNGALPRDLLLTDPDDPVGILYSEMERLPALDQNGNGNYEDSGDVPGMGTVFNELRLHTPDTFHAPMVVSAGIDEELGIHEPWNIAALGNLGAYDFAQLSKIQDNITSRNKVAGGKMSSGGGK